MAYFAAGIAIALDEVNVFVGAAVLMDLLKAHEHFPNRIHPL